MKLRSAVAVVAIGLSALTAASSWEPARAGTVDITPPEVGSCHDLTWDEAYGESEPLPPVDCTASHTLVTIKVVSFASEPDWGSATLANRVVRQCYKAEIDLFDSQVKSIQMSTYGIWFFYPTKAQQEAGARWARCDLGIRTTIGRTSNPTMKQLPTDGPPVLGPTPLPDSLAKCRKGKRGDFALTTCDRSHSLRLKRAVHYPGDSYPGAHRINNWTIDRCRRELGRSFGYWTAPSRYTWNAGFSYSLCYKTTSS